ncbi:hypothetical protein [[Flexibacter] sp. ATCC 35208]|uniref:hypothetical protein n=1 Tax=[Flexibacter] sp. ATCC 35208 TaxID=1936242 RepID=UPI0009CB1F91|nr:hypothetical protein [[Flexibacter] sp. ATCC 35208]OMP80133.1 hypothetical protein BW716_06470 [[Flexibacter] sp. ATCC 35208]
MKSLKMLFTALGVVTIVGSAFAVTKPYRLQTWCIRPAANGAGACTGTLVANQSTGTSNYFGYQRGTNCNNPCTAAVVLIAE